MKIPLSRADREAFASYGRRVRVLVNGVAREGRIVSHTVVGGGAMAWVVRYASKRTRLGVGWYRPEQVSFL